MLNSKTNASSLYAVTSPPNKLFSSLAVLLLLVICPLKASQSEQIFLDGFEARFLEFPQVTSAAQEPVENDGDADATATYGHDLSVVLSSGEARLDRNDLKVPGRGQIAFSFDRRYRSQINYDGPLGFGWDFNYNERLQVLPDGSVARSNGRSHVAVWQRNPDASYTAPTGYFATLTLENDGSYLLRRPDGFKCRYDAEGKLQQQLDRFGNSMHFSYDSDDNLTLITDAYGRRYELEYKYLAGRDRLVMLRDFANRETVYTYDNSGNLTAVRSPLITGTSTGNDFPSGRTESYSYYDASNPELIQHNLASITYPEEVSNNGDAAINISYGSAGIELDRVTSLTVGGINDSGINAGGTATFNATEMNTGVPLGDPSVVRLTVALTDRNGTEKTYLFNESSHLKIRRELTQGLRPVEPADYYETVFDYDADGQITRKMAPLGNEYLYSYDSLGSRAQQNNLIQITRVADAVRGGGEDLITTMTYEPVFNQLRSLTDPRGNAMNYTPPIGAASSARYTTNHYFDYQENNSSIPDVSKYNINLTGVPRNLGDLNQDGVTDQVAGNKIRTEQPTVMLRASANQALSTGSAVQAVVTEVQWNDRGQQLARIDPEGHVTRLNYYAENDPDGDGNTIAGQSSTSPRGYLQSSTTDSTPPSNRRTTAIPPLNLTRVIGYDAVGNITAKQNPRGVVSTFEYNQLNEMLVETRGADVDEAVTLGELITGEAAFNYRLRYYFDANGRLTLHESENASSTSTTAGIGNWVAHTYTYDILDNLIATTVEIDDTNTAESVLRYDANELLILQQKPEGNQVAIEYDERNLKYRVHQGFGSADTATYQVDYDLNGNQLRVTDAEDNDATPGPETTTYQYDGFDRNTMKTDALGNQAEWTYDPASNITHHLVRGHRPNQPANGNVLLKEQLFFHDELNRIYQSDQALFLADGFSPLRPEDLRDDNSDGRVTEYFEYDALSRQTFITEDDGDSRQNSYDGAHRLVSSTDPIGNQSMYTYDANDNLVSQAETDISATTAVPAETFTSYFVYDQLDRKVRSTDNAGRTTRYHYDSRDNLTALFDAQSPTLVADPWSLVPGQINQPGNSTRYFYDGRSLLITEVQDLRVGGNGDGAIDTSNPDNSDGMITVDYSYDLNSRLVAVTDDNSNTTSYAYDTLDRRVLQTNADATTQSQSYDRDGNLTSITDPNGSVITNSYDALNRLQQRNVVRAAGVVGTTTESYQYDGLSRLTQSIDNNGSANDHQIDRIYDSLSRLIEEQQDSEPHSNVWAGDNRRLILSYPTSRNIEFSYDALNRVIQVNDPNPTTNSAEGAMASGPMALTVLDTSWMGPETCSDACPCEARPLFMAMGNGTNMSFLDPTGLITVGYNQVREPVAMTHSDSMGTFIDREYGYNRQYMRISELMSDIAGAPLNLYALDSAYRSQSTLIDDFGGESFTQLIEYQLDGVGNRTAVDFTQDFGGPPITFSDTYQANVMNEYDDAGGGGGPRQHDNNGNLTDADGFLYRYDYRNRLVEVRRKTDNALRALYEYDTYNRRVQRTTYVMPTTDVDEERRYLYDKWHVIEEWADDDNYNNNGPIFTYVYGTGIDQPTQMQASITAPNPGTFWFHRDVRNNIIAVTDATGSVVESSRYDDFGNFEQPASIDNRYLYQGRRYDPETGFFYFRNRYYDPRTGRFLQRDPLWDAYNRGNQYTFVANNPMTGTDPLGQVWWNPFSWPDDYEDWKNASKSAKARKVAKEAKSIKDAVKSAKDSKSLTKRAGDLLKGVAKKPLKGTGSDPVGLMIQIDESLEVVAENAPSIGEKIKLAREIEESKHKIDPNYRLPMVKPPFEWCVLDWLYYDGENERRKKINAEWDRQAEEAESEYEDE